MPSYNKLIMVGHLVRDVSVKYLPSGTVVGESAIAVNHKYKDKESVCFLDFSVFGKGAENMSKYTGKGDPILLEGRLEQQTWDGKDGQKRSKHVMIVDGFQFLKQRSASQPAAAADDSGPIDPENIPF